MVLVGEEGDFLVECGLEFVRYKIIYGQLTRNMPSNILTIRQ